jgi:hypothetical protein
VVPLELASNVGKVVVYVLFEIFIPACHFGEFGNKVYWQLIGDAYVYKIMDRESIYTVSEELQSTEAEFEIR